MEIDFVELTTPWGTKSFRWRLSYLPELFWAKFAPEAEDMLLCEFVDVVDADDSVLTGVRGGARYRNAEPGRGLDLGIPDVELYDEVQQVLETWWMLPTNFGGER